MPFIAGNTDTRTLHRVMKGSLTVLGLGFVILGILKVSIHETASFWNFSKFVFTVWLIGSSYIWCLCDSIINDYPFGKYMMLLFALLLPLALIIYFYRSRGFQKGSLAIMKATGLFALFLILGAVSGVITSRIFGIVIQ